MYGTVAPNAVGVQVFTLDGVLVASFASQNAAAEWLGVKNNTVSQAIKLNSTIKKLYKVART